MTTASISYHLHPLIAQEVILIVVQTTTITHVQRAPVRCLDARHPTPQEGKIQKGLSVLQKVCTDFQLNLPCSPNIFYLLSNFFHTLLNCHLFFFSDVRFSLFLFMLLGRINSRTFFIVPYRCLSSCLSWPASPSGGYRRTYRCTCLDNVGQ